LRANCIDGSDNENRNPAAIKAYSIEVGAESALKKCKTRLLIGRAGGGLSVIESPAAIMLYFDCGYSRLILEGTPKLEIRRTSCSLIQQHDTVVRLTRVPRSHRKTAMELNQFFTKVPRDYLAWLR
jgi:hypothetical protein